MIRKYTTDVEFKAKKIYSKFTNVTDSNVTEENADN
jgi:hypothetical protein